MDSEVLQNLILPLASQYLNLEIFKKDLASSYYEFPKKGAKFETEEEKKLRNEKKMKYIKSHNVYSVLSVLLFSISNSIAFKVLCTKLIMQVKQVSEYSLLEANLLYNNIVKEFGEESLPLLLASSNDKSITSNFMISL